MCGSASLWSKVALGVLIVALILEIIALSTLGWALYQITTNRIRIGLFSMETCVADTCTTGDVDESLKDGNFNSTQAFNIIMLILLIFAILFVIVYIVVQSMRNNCLALTAATLSFVACFCGFVAMICWLVYVKDPYVVGFSLGLSVLSALLCLIGGLLLLPDVFDNQQQAWQ